MIRINIKELLNPNWKVNDKISEISINHLLSKDIKALILDVDGTLISGNNPVLANDIKNWIQNSNEHFFIYLFSNNPSRNRIKKIADQLNLDFTYSGGKPSTRKLKKVLSSISYSSNQIAIIGDRVFTDILVGNRLGMYTILVDSVDYYGKKIERNNFQFIERYLAKIITGEFL
ncbi:YqeG family HAD IIIA-type phosphatase [Prochlorococcus marinus]|uniref:YqeG family HAD IIIA-type phosphatase n=1 Tax=Prochlorococcus marinus XMU1408 TaxID=2213228 RepID=A0A318R0W8_PROMR|nr:YqeG family HAD IIIA-type phosphatase [Prochlorococcus marinus str. XMU1408]PYE02936.1 YqeG family HAD IIIA-type phosphatase [Prochlorococcus marinus XMU1408]